jgi:hypothetical protein
MEPNHTRNTHARSLQVRHTSRDPIGANAHSRERMHSCFRTQVVDLRGRGVKFEESVVDGARDGLGEGIHGLLALFTVDGGDGGGDYGGPFLVGVAVCHFCWWRGFGEDEVRGVFSQGSGPAFNVLSFFLCGQGNRKGKPRYLCVYCSVQYLSLGGFLAWHGMTLRHYG